MNNQTQHSFDPIYRLKNLLGQLQSWWLERLNGNKEQFYRRPLQPQGEYQHPSGFQVCGLLFMEIIGLSGKKFNRLTAIKISHRHRNRIYWLCICDCGKEHPVQAAKLKNGHTKSCGCHRTEVCRSVKSHGESAGGSTSNEYSIWSQIVSRCNNSASKAYLYYGGRGIKMCERWLDVSNFIADMGRRPSKLHSVERRDNNKGYYPENCYWATKKEQANNRRSNVLIEFNGEKKNIQQWSEKTGISYGVLHSRIQVLGWPAEKALTTTPVKSGYKQWRKTKN